jgi:hypothetical protein
LVGKARLKYSKVIKAATKELVDIALVKLLSEVRQRRPSPSLVPEQSDLFDALPGAVVVPGVGQNGKHVYRNALFSDLTLMEALDWVESHSRDNSERIARMEQLRELLDRVAPFMTSDSTVGEGVMAEAASRELEEVEVPAKT